MKAFDKLKSKFKGIFRRKSKKNNDNVQINDLHYPEILDMAPLNREPSSEFKSFADVFEKTSISTLQSMKSYDSHNVDYMDGLIDSEVYKEMNWQASYETIARQQAAKALQARAKELFHVMQHRLQMIDEYITSLRTKLDKAGGKYNRNTYDAEEDYEDFAIVENKTNKKLSSLKGGMGAFTSVLIIGVLTLADGVNLFSTFESIDMLPFAVQLLMTSTAALILELAPTFVGNILASLKYCTKQDKSKKVLMGVLGTVFVTLVIGITCLRMYVLYDTSNKSDISFDDSYAVEEQAEPQGGPSPSEVAYQVFLSGLMCCTSAVAFYIGYMQGDKVLSEATLLNDELNNQLEKQAEMEAAIIRLQDYIDNDEFEQLDQQRLAAVMSYLDSMGRELKVLARTHMYKGLPADQISYIAESANEIAAGGAD